MEGAQVKMTDLIRGAFMQFVWEDDDVECANLVQKILNELTTIDLRFEEAKRDKEREREHSLRYFREKRDLEKKVEELEAELKAFKLDN